MEGHDVKATTAQFAGKEGENFVGYMFSKNNIVCNSLSESDFGEDFLCDIFAASNNPKIKVRTNFSFRTQVKSTECPSPNGYIRKTSHGYAVKLSVGLLNTWKESFYPVVLVIYDCSESCAYWCFPIEQVSHDLGDAETKTITAPFENRLDDAGVRNIREEIVKYYSNLFKIQDATLRCSIFPIWMPQYRLLTSLEILELFPENAEIKTAFKSRNILPSFISSYHTCEHSEGLACLEYSSAYQSLEAYIDNVIAYLDTVNYRSTEEKWLSLIITPIDIVTKHENRCISTATDWMSLSLLSSGSVYDYSHNFDPGSHYHYSEKIRALSDDSDFFIHESGEFVTETIVESYLFNSRKQQFHLTNDILDKSMCILDISECTEQQIADLEKWCYENDHQLIMVEDDVHAIIAHPFMGFGSFGSILPGTARWSDWDKLKYNTSEFASKIPCGTPLSRTAKFALLDAIISLELDDGDTCALSYSHALAGETLIHNKRVIRLVCYILPMDVEKCNNLLSDTEKHIRTVYPNCRLYCDKYDDLWDVVLEATPTSIESTQLVLSTIEKAYLELIAKIKKESNTSKNMGYYTERLLGRWIPPCVPVIE